ncbi:hypothetical protein E1B28_011670 [Marasmius oreades]|uniref:Uncharacterized protein n=1 Tax=Marasmius oreades TaxID=181124 RepID=A0A9P7RVN2_9AGAR|nr:uncharacterized protein E1B28_011670 [Marasmius oreades]KAG7090051.1 hypothetical protein E1B28_011670 [Marasmius oreades]
MAPKIITEICGDSWTFNLPLRTSPIRLKIDEYLSLHPGNYIASVEEFPSVEDDLRDARDELTTFDREKEKIISLLDELEPAKIHCFTLPLS